MPKHRHDLTPHTITTSSAAHHGPCPSSQLQSAAAWAWLQHGGGTCITPRRAEGLMAANLNARFKQLRPSRFKLELIILRRAMEDTAAAPFTQHSKWVAAEGKATSCTRQASRRRHSFHHDNLPAGRTSTVGSLSSCCSTTGAAPSPTWPAQTAVADHSDHDVMKGYDSHGDDDASALLDKFELDAVCRQLHLQFSSTPTSCKTERPQGLNAVDSPPELKPHRRLYDDLPTHKAWRSLSTRLHHHHHQHHGDDHGDGGHHHQYGHLLHQLLRFRSGRSPAYCSSIATVNSIVDHHQSVTPKKFRSHVLNQENLQDPAALIPVHGHTEQIGRMRKHSRAKLKSPHHRTLLKCADAEAIAAVQKLQEKGSSVSGHGHKLPPPSPELAAPARSHYSDSKVFQSLIDLHRLPQSSHISHGSASKGFGTNHLHLHDHQHFHHHHHYHHHDHLHDQQNGADDALLDHLSSCRSART